MECHPLKSGGGAQNKGTVQQIGFGQSTPLIIGVNLRPLDWGGMGCQG